MNTDQLLALISNDTVPVRPLHKTLLLVLSLGTLASAFLMSFTVGVRSDFGSVTLEPRVIVKHAITLMTVIFSILVVFRIGRPGLPLGGYLRLLLVPVAVLAIAVAVELSVLPPDRWIPSLIGHNAAFCLFFIPALSLLPFLGFFWAMRDGAPERPGWAGAACGLGSAAIGAFIYALHCPDDSPLFVMTWYVISMAAVTLIGAVAGRRLLRW